MSAGRELLMERLQNFDRMRSGRRGREDRGGEDRGREGEGDSFEDMIVYLHEFVKFRILFHPQIYFCVTF